jgi:hypothetical protein
MRAITCVVSLLMVNFTTDLARSAENELSLSDLVREVKVALLQVNEAAENQHLPALNNAVLQANTSMKVDDHGKISLWVIEIGGGQSHEISSNVTLTLKPPPPGSSSNIETVHLADALKEAILAGARAIDVAKEGNPPLIADKLEASVHFAIQRDAKGGISVKFPPFDASAGAQFTGNELQTITVTYATK